MAFSALALALCPLSQPRVSSGSHLSSFTFLPGVEISSLLKLVFIYFAASTRARPGSEVPLSPYIFEFTLPQRAKSRKGECPRAMAFPGAFPERCGCVRTRCGRACALAYTRPLLDSGSRCALDAYRG